MSSVRNVPKFMNAKRSCNTCKYHDKGLCRLFLYTLGPDVSFAKTIDVRFDEKLCGPEGLFWTSFEDSDSDQIWYSDISDFLI